MSIELWYEKYRPRSLDEYVWRDPQMRSKVEEWLAQNGLPHVLFSGTSGTGKTSLALLILQLLGIPPEDLLKIKASRERKIEDLQDKIGGFINGWAFNRSGLKYILLDEADKLSQHAQGMLRNEMDVESCRFILTCNYPNKIIAPLHGRLQEIKFKILDQGEFVNRVADVMLNENVAFEPEVLMQYTDRIYPDLRKCIGLLQQNTIEGVLKPLRDDDEGSKDYLIDAIDMFKNGHFLEARKLIIAQADAEEYDSIYRFFYQNLHLFGATQDQQDAALVIIGKYLFRDGAVTDREINLAAALAELCRVNKGVKV